jgi:3-methylcrotonyl-CoA carboxylase alpha subunit
MKLSCGGITKDVLLEAERASLSGRTVPFRASRDGGELRAVEVGDRIYAVRALRDGRRVRVWCAGKSFEFQTASATARSREAASDLLAPMPGLLRRVDVSEGATVARGQVLMILEAMKMEHAIRAPKDGIVSRLPHGEGDLVEAGTPLAEIT